MTLKSFMTGVAVGAVIGGVTAVLLTPKNGKEMRCKVAGHGKKACESVNDFYQNIKSVKECNTDAGLNEQCIELKTDEIVKEEVKSAKITDKK